MSLTVAEQEAATWRRLSAKMLLIHPVRELVRYIPALAGLVIAGRRVGDGQWWWLGPLGVVVVIVGSMLRWATTRYRITPEQVQLRTGMLHRQTIATPADRVRTVDVTASLLHRLLGLAKVEIGTGSHQLLGALSLDSLPVAEAAALRAELLHRSAKATIEGPGAAEAGTVPAGDVIAGDVIAGDVPSGAVLAAGDDDTELARLDPRWVRFAPFTMSGILGALAIVGVGWNLLDQMGVVSEEVGPAQETIDQLGRIPIWVDVSAGMVALVVFVTVLSISAYVLSYWGFRLTRHAQGSLHVTRGLLTTRATSIEERRLRGVELSEPLLLRAVHAARLNGITTGLNMSGAADGGSSLLLPPAPYAVVVDVASQILGDPAAVETSLTAHGPAARRRRYIRAFLLPFVLIAAAVVAIFFGAPRWLALPALLTLPASAMLAADRYRSLGHAIAGTCLVTRAGSFSRRRDVLECDGIIGWNLRQTFFQRRAGLATLTATTAAGGQAYAVTDVPLPMALSLGNRALPGLLADFLASDPVPALGPVGSSDSSAPPTSADRV